MMIKFGRNNKVAMDNDSKLKKDSIDTDRLLRKYLISHYKNTMTKEEYARIRNQKTKSAM